MSDIQIFNYNDNNVRTVEMDGEPWFVLRDVCQILSIGNAADVYNRLDEDEKGVGQIDTIRGRQKMNIINESGLYSVILRSDKPEAKPFRKWVTSEVLPSIRRHGSYAASAQPKAMTEYQQMQAETRQSNIAIQKARLLNQIASEYEGAYRQVLQAYATKELTGDFLLPLPKLEEKTYSAGEIGKLLDISANKVGVLTNRHGLKTEKYGAWFADKAKGHNKEVSTFRYYQAVIPALKAILERES